MAAAEPPRKFGPARFLVDRPNAPAHPAALPLTVGLLSLGLTFLCWWALSGSTDNWAAVWRYRRAFWTGWLLTIGLSAASLVLSTLIGMLAALLRRSPFLPLRGGAIVYIETIRGTPLLVQLLFFYYVVFASSPNSLRLPIGILVLSLFSGAYIAEMIRAGIESVGASQLESARAIGLTPAQTYRFVIFPQALRQTIPPLAGQFASIIKDSSLLSVLGIAEFTHSAQQVNSATFSTLESFLPLAIGYLILTLPVSLLSKWLESRLRYET